MGLVSLVERVFGAASHKKVWDHFTKAQRKNIDLWKKQSLVRILATQKKTYHPFLLFVFLVSLDFHLFIFSIHPSFLLYMTLDV